MTILHRSPWAKGGRCPWMRWRRSRKLIRKTPEQQFPITAKQLYPTLKEDEVQLLATAVYLSCAVICGAPPLSCSPSLVAPVFNRLRQCISFVVPSRRGPQPNDRSASCSSVTP